MKICIIHPTLSSRGAERVSLTVAEYLAKKGNTVIYITLFCEKNFTIPSLKGVTFVLPPVFWQRAFEKRALLVIFGFFVLFFLSLVRAKKSDVINVHNHPAPWVGVIVGKLLHIPVVWSVFSIPMSVSWKEKTSLTDFFVWKIACSFIDTFFIRHIPVLINQDKMEADKTYERYHKKSLLILPPLSKTCLEYKPKKGRQNFLQGEIVLLQAAYLHFRKNQKVSIETLSLILPKIKNACLILVGDGPDKSKLIHMVEKRGLSSHVTFTGNVSLERLYNLYAQANVVLVPSLHEPFGLAPFEALCVGTISVVSTQAGSASVVQQEKIGYIAKPNAANFVREVLIALKNPQNTAGMIVKGKRFIHQHMTGEKYAASYEAVFKEAIEKYKTQRL